MAALEAAPGFRHFYLGNRDQMADLPFNKNTFHRLLPPLAALLTFAVFLPALGNGFVNWDDFENLVGNPLYRGLGLEQLSWMFTTFHLGHYQPLSWVSFGFDYLVWGMDPFGYHLSSVLLHCLNALAFSLLCARLLAAAAPPSSDEERTALSISACFAALFFALHPLRVESVAWATERRDVLSGLFYLLAVLWYLPRRAEDGTDTFKRSILSPFAFLLSLLSKSIGMTLPVILVALDIYPLRRLPPDPRRWTAPEYRRLWLEKVPFVVLAAVFTALAYLSAERSGVVISYQQQGPVYRAAQSLYAAGFYLWKSIVPLDLSPLYRLPAGFGPSSWQALSGGAAVAALTAGAIALRRRFPAGLLVWFFYLVTLSPVLGLVKGGAQAVADRYSYLSCLGFAVLLGAGIRAGLRAAPRPARIACSLLSCLAISVLVLLTWRQQRIWRDPETLWTHAVAVNPEADFPRGILGMVLDKQGRFEEAAAQYREALRLNPGLWKAHNYLGSDLAALGRFDEAASHFREAVKLNPGYAEAHYNLSLILAGQGKREEAVRHRLRALELKPGLGGPPGRSGR